MSGIDADGDKYNLKIPVGAEGFDDFVSRFSKDAIKAGQAAARTTFKDLVKAAREDVDGILGELLSNGNQVVNALGADLEVGSDEEPDDEPNGDDDATDGS